MTRPLHVLAATTAAFIASPGWACAGGNGPGADALALGYFVQEIEDATQFDGRRPGIRIDLVDLNGDGCQDAIVFFRSAFLGGARGCSTHVLDMGFDPPREIGAMLTCGAVPAATLTNGWRDLRGIDGGRWSYIRERYEWSEQ